MAQTEFYIRAELDLIRDAIDTLVLIHERLAYRHGETFRALDRRIEGLAETNLRPATIHQMTGGGLTLIPEVPEAVRSIIADARALGVI